tara:strand:+ start:541 stop:657 length:117 start_codon:yes stop_codon:yes gene_type:complete
MVGRKKKEEKRDNVPDIIVNVQPETEKNPFGDVSVSCL